MSIKPPRQAVTPPGVVVPATLLTILEQRPFGREKLRDRASPLTQAALMHAALNHQSRLQPITTL